MITLIQEARDKWFGKTIQGKGGYCPCCDRWGKINGRTLNEAMARALIWLASQRPNHPLRLVHVPTAAPGWVLRTKQLSSLKHWGLIERPEKTHKLQNFSGMWRVTEKGHLFARSRITVHAKVWIYDDKLMDFSGQVLIQQCFKVPFNYGKMMQEFYSAETVDDWPGKL